MSGLILLGVEDAVISTNEDLECDMLVSKVGGRPNCPYSSTLSNADVECTECGQTLALIVQIYAPIGGSVHDRTLYVLACVSVECATRGRSWCCVRVQRESQHGCGEPACHETSTQMSNNSWIATADDWSDDDDDVNEAGVSALSLRCDEDSKDAEPHHSLPPTPRQNARCVPANTADAFSSFYLAVIDEATCGGHSDGDWQHELELLRRYENTVNISVGGSVERSGGDESYESSSPAHGDRYLHRMQRRLARRPDQLLRYCRDSHEPPLYLASPQLHEVPATCQYCGGRRQFELQLLPTLVWRLEAAVRSEHVHVPCVGTVVVFTCVRSCWTQCDTVRHEAVFVQMEPNTTTVASDLHKHTSDV